MARQRTIVATWQLTSCVPDCCLVLTLGVIVHLLLGIEATYLHLWSLMAPVPSGTEKDIFLGYGNIVGFLIAVHVVAFLFWLYLLARGGTRPLKKVATD
ncbi:hypothetical protein COCOBI_09-1730 [Coccomyxa sp. Obi]|nr:hypothetical protein COCOBI_09-1730 [Coccomyxa sp. Obi]